MTFESFAAWVLSTVVATIPPSTVPKWAETLPDTANAIATVAFGEAPLFAGEIGQAKTAALLVVLLKTESSGNTHALGDHDMALGGWQIHASSYAPEAAHREAFLADTVLQARVALRMLRQSITACSMREPENRLAWYASGDCGHGGAASRYRMSLVSKLLSDHPVTP